MIAIFQNKNIRNSVWNLLDILLYPAVFFLTVSYFIERLGTTDFGIWMLVNTLIVGMQIFNFGIGPGVLKNMAYFLGTGDRNKMTQVWDQAMSISFVLVGLVASCAILLAVLVYYAGFLNVDESSLTSTTQCILLSGILVSCRFIEQIITAYYKAGDRFRNAALITIGNRLFPHLLNMVLLALIPGIGVRSILLNMVFINGCVIIIYCIRIRHSLSQTPFQFSLTKELSFSRFAFIMWLQSLAMIIIFQADRYLVMHYYGFAVLSYYALTATIFNHLHMGYNATLGWLAPKFTRMYAQGIDTHYLYLAAQYWVILISVPSLLIFYFLYPTVFPWILGNEVAASIHLYVRYFIIFQLFFILTIIPAFYFNATGKELSYLLFIGYYLLSSLVMMWFFMRYIHQPISMLYALILATTIGVWVQNTIAEWIVFKSQFNMLRPAKLMLPSLLASISILLSNTWWGQMSLLACLLSLYFLFFRNKTDLFKQLFRA